MTTEKMEQWMSRLSAPLTTAGLPEELNGFCTRLNSAPGLPVVVSARLIGSGAGTALQKDQAYLEARNAGQMKAARSRLVESPATGCAMIMTLARNASGFNPRNLNQSDNQARFQDYLQQLFNCPVLHTAVNDRKEMNWSADWGTIVDKILEHYQGIAAQDRENIKNSLWSLAHAAASSPNTNEQLNLFVQNSIEIEGSIKIYLYKSFVLMRQDKHKGSGKNAPTRIKNEAYFQLYRVIMDFDQAGWPAYAPTIMERTNTSLTDWLGENTTPQGNAAVHWTCGPPGFTPGQPLPFGPGPIL